jgi:hypothetical protein
MDSGPLLYSYVIQNISWQMGFWFVTIPLGIAVLLVFFFVPEVSSCLIEPLTRSGGNRMTDDLHS